MCFPQKKGDKICACCCGEKTESSSTFCDCSDMKKSFEERMSAIEKKLENSN